MVKVRSMNRTIRLLLVTSVALVAAHPGNAWSWKGTAKSASPKNSANPAAAVLSSIDADAANGKLVLHTSATPVYTSYSPQPDVFVIDLTGVTKGSGMVIPAALPAGVNSIAADDVVEMGAHITRVTLRFAQAVSPHVSASENNVVIALPAPAVAESVVAPSSGAKSGSTALAAMPPAAVTETEPSHQPIVEPAAASEPLTPAQKATLLRSVATAGSGTSLEISLATNGDPAYKAFRLDKPARIVVDLTGVKDALKKNSIDLGDPFVRRIRVSQFKGGSDPVTRVVLDLDERVDYRVSKDGERLKISFGSAMAAAASTPPSSSSPAVITHVDMPVASTESPASSPSLSNSSSPSSSSTDIASQVPAIAPSAERSDWKMTDSAKTARPVITAPAAQTAPAAPTRKAQSAATSTATPANTATGSTMSAAVPGSEDVFSDQATSANSLASTAGGRMATRTLSGTERIFTGEPISLNLKEADIKDVLRTFAQITGLNIAVDPGVSGSVTVEFTEVPWDQALDLILRQNGLTYVIEGNVMRVGKLDIISRETEQNRKLAEEERLNVPLQTVSFKLSYARAADVQVLLREMASPRAKMIVDTRTNQLVISEIPAYLQTMKNLIDSIDVPTPQVLIEARIVETTKTFLQQYGISWGFNGVLNPGLGTGTGLVFPYSGTIKGGPFEFATGNPLITTHFTNVLGTFDLDLMLAAAESEGLVKIISAPRITTQDNTAAEIQSGLQIPYQTRVNFTTTIQYVDATLRLSVTPQITEQGTVIMDISVSKNEPALGLALEGGSGTPLSTRRATTKLMVRDGGTSVIGGIYQSSENNSQSRVPFLHEIPIIGNLFKNHNISTRHDELLIFITPRIIRNS
jgi:type IV pilus secretin PilQ/predicted competence protein